ncbi:unnamed protein product [Calypogeia fissa]
MASPEVAVLPVLQGLSINQFNSSSRVLKLRNNSQTSAVASQPPAPTPASETAPSLKPTWQNSCPSPATSDIDPAMSLPMIDLGGLRSGDPADRARIVKELGEATAEWGFFQVVNHSVTDELQDKMQALAQDFFSLPMDVKKRAEIVGHNHRLFGYKPVLRAKKEGDEKILFKEALADSREPEFSIESLIKQIWPGGNPTVSDTITEHCESVEALGRTLLELMAESLGVPTNYYSRHFKNPEERYGTWRLHHFTATSHPYDLWRTPPHSDPSVLTLLKQDVGALQVKKAGGNSWIDIKPLPGSYVINVGDILEAWTNGRFPSVEHRVALKEDVERYSMVVFLDARPEMLIEAPKELIDDEHPAQFRPFIAGDYRTNFDKTKRAGNIRKGTALDYVRNREHSTV